MTASKTSRHDPASMTLADIQAGLEAYKARLGKNSIGASNIAAALENIKAYGAMAARADSPAPDFGALATRKRFPGKNPVRPTVLEFNLRWPAGITEHDWRDRSSIMRFVPATGEVVNEKQRRHYRNTYGPHYYSAFEKFSSCDNYEDADMFAVRDNALYYRLDVLNASVADHASERARVASLWIPLVRLVRIDKRYWHLYRMTSPGNPASFDELVAHCCAEYEANPGAGPAVWDCSDLLRLKSQGKPVMGSEAAFPHGTINLGTDDFPVLSYEPGENE